MTKSTLCPIRVCAALVLLLATHLRAETNPPTLEERPARKRDRAN